MIECNGLILLQCYGLFHTPVRIHRHKPEPLALQSPTDPGTALPGQLLPLWEAERTAKTKICAAASLKDPAVADVI